MEFSSDDVFIDAVVAGNAHVIEGGLVVFLDTHFEVDGVAVDVHFHGSEVVEDVAVVVIHIANGVVVFVESFIEQALVVDVATLHLQHVLQQV